MDFCQSHSCKGKKRPAEATSPFIVRGEHVYKQSCHGCVNKSWESFTTGERRHRTTRPKARGTIINEKNKRLREAGRGARENKMFYK